MGCRDEDVIRTHDRGAASIRPAALLASWCSTQSDVLAGVAEWHTRTPQKRLSLGACGFESRSRHNKDDAGLDSEPRHCSAIALPSSSTSRTDGRDGGGLDPAVEGERSRSLSVGVEERRTPAGHRHL